MIAKLSERQKEYRRYFKKKLDDYGVNSPAELSEQDKTKFFNEVREEWKEDSPAASQLIEVAEILSFMGNPEIAETVKREFRHG